MSRGDFTRRIRIGERATGWRESELGAWLASRSAASQTRFNACPASEPVIRPSLGTHGA
ncbi:helix-turn-helix transcriptional regulator [Burkholderia multivorans]|uniref:helix-turn-helix transcriptional regulator n=1 Tax=Burkholderia multivorans TaxID=87883 RepID=UPI002236BC10|nr:AlpA family phage regulatory protein [Burkholderia multivorans]